MESREPFSGLPPERSEALQIEQEGRGEAVVYRCRGAFSLDTHARLDELVGEIRRTRMQRIVLDLLEVGGLDSVGVGTLAMILKETMDSGRSWCWWRASPCTRRSARPAWRRPSASPPASRMPCAPPLPETAVGARHAVPVFHADTGGN